VAVRCRRGSEDAVLHSAAVTCGQLAVRISGVFTLSDASGVVNPVFGLPVPAQPGGEHAGVSGPVVQLGDC
jgi:hypothetical protein